MQTPVAPRRVRALPRLLAISLIIIAAAACWRVWWIRFGFWAKYTPTWVLAELDYLPMPGRVESVMLERIRRGSVGPWQQRRVVHLAIHHLGNDRRERNERWAHDVLWFMGRDAAPWLEDALNDPDYQRRQCAGRLLRARAEFRYWDMGPPEGFEASDRLLEVSVEAFRADCFIRDDATSSFEFLLRYRERVLPILGRSIMSDDERQAFQSAVMIGLLRAKDLAPVAAPILVKHLKDNRCAGDAVSAAPALLCLGDAARPYLLPAIDGNDAQAKEMAWAIVKTLDHQRLSAAERDMIKKVTVRYEDLRAAASRYDDLWVYYRF
jgi:hypothetical protein